MADGSSPPTLTKESPQSSPPASVISAATQSTQVTVEASTTATTPTTISSEGMAAALKQHLSQATDVTHQNNVAVDEDEDDDEGRLSIVTTEQQQQQRRKERFDSQGQSITHSPSDGDSTARNATALTSESSESTPKTTTGGAQECATNVPLGLRPSEQAGGATIANTIAGMVDNLVASDLSPELNVSTNNDKNSASSPNEQQQPLRDVRSDLAAAKTMIERRQCPLCSQTQVDRAAVYIHSWTKHRYDLSRDFPGLFDPVDGGISTSTATSTSTMPNPSVSTAPQTLGEHISNLTMSVIDSAVDDDNNHNNNDHSTTPATPERRKSAIMSASSSHQTAVTGNHGNATTIVLPNKSYSVTVNVPGTSQSSAAHAHETHQNATIPVSAIQHQHHSQSQSQSHHHNGGGAAQRSSVIKRQHHVSDQNDATLQQIAIINALNGGSANGGAGGLAQNQPKRGRYKYSGVLPGQSDNVVGSPLNGADPSCMAALSRLISPVVTGPNAGGLLGIHGQLRSSQAGGAATPNTSALLQLQTQNLLLNGGNNSGNAVQQNQQQQLLNQQYLQSLINGGSSTPTLLQQQQQQQTVQQHQNVQLQIQQHQNQIAQLQQVANMNGNQHTSSPINILSNGQSNGNPTQSAAAALIVAQLQQLQQQSQQLVAACTLSGKAPDQNVTQQLVQLQQQQNQLVQQLQQAQAAANQSQNASNALLLQQQQLKQQQHQHQQQLSSLVSLPTSIFNGASTNGGLSANTSLTASLTGLHQCERCAYVARTHDELVKHQLEHVARSQQKCVTCQLTFSSTFELNQHFLTKHQDIALMSGLTPLNGSNGGNETPRATPTTTGTLPGLAQKSNGHHATENDAAIQLLKLQQKKQQLMQEERALQTKLAVQTAAKAAANVASSCASSTTTDSPTKDSSNHTSPAKGSGDSGCISDRDRACVEALLSLTQPPADGAATSATTPSCSGPSSGGSQSGKKPSPCSSSSLSTSTSNADTSPKRNGGGGDCGGSASKPHSVKSVHHGNAAGNVSEKERELMLQQTFHESADYCGTDSDAGYSGDELMTPPLKQGAPVSEKVRQAVRRRLSRPRPAGEPSVADGLVQGDPGASHSNDQSSTDMLLPYKCGICHYRARWPSEITQHMKNHSTDKPYKCPHCKYCSKWKWDVVKHMKRCNPPGGTLEDVIYVPTSNAQRSGFTGLMTDPGANGGGRSHGTKRHSNGAPLNVNNLPGQKSDYRSKNGHLHHANGHHGNGHQGNGHGGLQLNGNIAALIASQQQQQFQLLQQAQLQHNLAAAAATQQSQNQHHDIMNSTAIPSVGTLLNKGAAGAGANLMKLGAASVLGGQHPVTSAGSDQTFGAFVKNLTERSLNGGNGGTNGGVTTNGNTAHNCSDNEAEVSPPDMSMHQLMSSKLHSNNIHLLDPPSSATTLKPIAANGLLVARQLDMSSVAATTTTTAAMQHNQHQLLAAKKRRLETSPPETSIETLAHMSDMRAPLRNSISPDANALLQSIRNNPALMSSSLSAIQQQQLQLMHLQQQQQHHHQQQQHSTLGVAGNGPSAAQTAAAAALAQQQASNNDIDVESVSPGPQQQQQLPSVGSVVKSVANGAPFSTPVVRELST